MTTILESVRAFMAEEFKGGAANISDLISACQEAESRKDLASIVEDINNQKLKEDATTLLQNGFDEGVEPELISLKLMKLFEEHEGKRNDSNLTDINAQREAGAKKLESYEKNLLGEGYGEWVEVASKSVPDVDGFWTDYTWYNDGNGRHVFIFGDKDIYNPEDDIPDHEVDGDYSEAEEWFDSFEGTLDFDEECEECFSLGKVAEAMAWEDDEDDDDDWGTPRLSSSTPTDKAGEWSTLRYKSSEDLDEGAEGRQRKGYKWIIYQDEEPYKIVAVRSTHTEAQAYILKHLDKDLTCDEVEEKYAIKGRNYDQDLFEESYKRRKEDILKDIEWFEKIIENPNGPQAKNQMLNIGPGVDVIKNAQSHIRALKRQLDARDFREPFDESYSSDVEALFNTSGDEWQYPIAKATLDTEVWGQYGTKKLSGGVPAMKYWSRGNTQEVGFTLKVGDPFVVEEKYGSIVGFWVPYNKGWVFLEDDQLYEDEYEIVKSFYNESLNEDAVKYGTVRNPKIVSKEEVKDALNKGWDTEHFKQSHSFQDAEKYVKNFPNAVVCTYKKGRQHNVYPDDMFIMFKESLSEGVATQVDWIKSFEDCKSLKDFESLSDRLDALRTIPKAELKPIIKAQNEARKRLNKNESLNEGRKTTSDFKIVKDSDGTYKVCPASNLKSSYEDGFPTYSAAYSWLRRSGLIKKQNESLNESLDKGYERTRFRAEVYNMLDLAVSEFENALNVQVDKDDIEDALDFFSRYYMSQEDFEFDESLEEGQYNTATIEDVIASLKDAAASGYEIGFEDMEDIVHLIANDSLRQKCLDILEGGANDNLSNKRIATALKRQALGNYVGCNNDKNLTKINEALVEKPSDQEIRIAQRDIEKEYGKCMYSKFSGDKLYFINKNGDEVSVARHLNEEAEKLVNKNNGLEYTHRSDTFNGAEYDYYRLGYISGVNCAATVYYKHAHGNKGYKYYVQQHHPYNDAEYSWAYSHGGKYWAIVRNRKVVDNISTQLEDFEAVAEYIVGRDKDVEPKMVHN